MNTRLNSVLILAAALSVPALTPLSAADQAQAPKPISQVAPSYPQDLRWHEIEGSVLIDFTINSQGEVTDMKTVRFSDKAFIEPVRDAVRKWKFAPTVQNGVAVNVRARQIVQFKLHEAQDLNTTPLIVLNTFPDHK